MANPSRARRAVGFGASGQYLDCDGSRLHAVSVSAVDGLPIDQAIYAGDRTQPSLLFAQGVRRMPKAFRPALVRVPCTGQTRFTGTWIAGLGDEQTNDAGVPYRLPYTATFETNNGAGLPLQHWEKLTIQAEISASTTPHHRPRMW